MWYSEARRWWKGKMTMRLITRGLTSAGFRSSVEESEEQNVQGKRWHLRLARIYLTFYIYCNGFIELSSLVLYCDKYTSLFSSLRVIRRCLCVCNILEISPETKRHGKYNTVQFIQDSKLTHRTLFVNLHKMTCFVLLKRSLTVVSYNIKEAATMCLSSSTADLFHLTGLLFHKVLHMCCCCVWRILEKTCSIKNL